MAISHGRFLQATLLITEKHDANYWKFHRLELPSPPPLYKVSSLQDSAGLFHNSQSYGLSQIFITISFHFFSFKWA